MKVLVFILCLLIALLGGFLAYAHSSGQLLVFKAPEEEVVDAEEKRPALNEQVDLVDELVESLQRKREDMESRELLIQKREKDLQERELAYQKLNNEVEDLMDDLEDRIIEINKTEYANSKQLAGVYSKMDPSAAFSALRDMDSVKVAMILSQMDGRSMATIMEAAAAGASDGGLAAAEWSDAIQRLSEQRGER
ncbi:MAG: hypothetical protein JXR23_05020 [Pontiellaceae bacterium]|nr:hypothetical protein [Pontiellaceae bacterium]